MSVLPEASLPNRLYKGKVRDIYDMRQWRFFALDPAGDLLLMVATDRVSAFDVVLPSLIPDKGKVLSLLSAFWFRKTASLVPNHFGATVNKTWLHHNKGRVFKAFERSFRGKLERELMNRAMIVRRAQRIDVECVVRGYISGSAWAEYQKSGAVCGVALPNGLKESGQLPQPIFTPTTKAESGHDEAITIEQMKGLIGEALTGEIVEKSMAIYEYAAQYALGRGIIMADTKLEFGMVGDKLILIDELLTPDSSRFWDAETYSPGKPQPSFDKQPLRDWLSNSGWNKEPPAPELPEEVIEDTAQRYREAYRRLTGKEL